VGAQRAGDPPGRTAELEQHFSRHGAVAVWTGRIDVGALDVLWTGLGQAGFPKVPGARPVAGATMRSLTVEEDGSSEQALVEWDRAASLPGYAEAFDVLDGVIRQLSGGTVGHPTRLPTIVRDVVAVSGSAPPPGEPRPAPPTEARSARLARAVRLLLVVGVFVAGCLLVYQPVRRIHELDRYADQLRRTGEQVQAVADRRVEYDAKGNKTQTWSLHYDFHGESYEGDIGCDPCTAAGSPVLIWVNPKDPRDYVDQYGGLSGNRHRLDFLLGVLGGALLLSTPAILVWQPGRPEPQPEPKPEPARAADRRPRRGPTRCVGA
jgi:hypothetical protein